MQAVSLLGTSDFYLCETYVGSKRLNTQNDGEGLKSQGDRSPKPQHKTNYLDLKGRLYLPVKLTINLQHHWCYNLAAGFSRLSFVRKLAGRGILLKIVIVKLK